MIVQCADCKTRYELDESRVPKRELRVRCPKCRSVFGIDGRRAAGPRSASAGVTPASSAGIQLDRAPASAPIEPTPVPETVEPSAGIEIERNGFANTPVSPEPVAEMEFEIERSAAPAVKPLRPAAGVGEPAAPAVNAATAVADVPAKPKVDDKAKRLARALVSDILVYHRDARDQALADGNLVQVLGQEIKKSWELYKERITPEVANETNYFREALNEILADGQQIF